MDTPQPLYDLAPIARLMLLGVLIALGPLAWVGWRNRNSSPMRRLQALTVLTLFLTFDLVLFGAFTRLTDSGLGCPDWPGCYGAASPIGAHADIAAARGASGTGFSSADRIGVIAGTGVGSVLIAPAGGGSGARSVVRGDARGTGAGCRIRPPPVPFHGCSRPFAVRGRGRGA